MIRDDRLAEGGIRRRQGGADEQSQSQRDAGKKPERKERPGDDREEEARNQETDNRSGVPAQSLEVDG